MEFLKIAVATNGLAESLRESITAAANARADGVQFDVRSELTSTQFGETASRELVHNLSERGMKIASTVFPLRRPLGDPEHLDGRIAAVKEAMRLTARLKCRILSLRVGRIPDNEQKEDLSRLADALNDLARLGSREGVMIAVATAGDSPETLRSLLSKVDEGPIGVDFDPAGCVTSQLDPPTVLKTLHDQVIHVQGRDAVRDVETGGYEVSLGRGESPWDEILAILADMHYSGWLTVRRTSGTDRLGESARAVAYLRTVATGG